MVGIHCREHLFAVDIGSRSAALSGGSYRGDLDKAEQVIAAFVIPAFSLRLACGSRRRDSCVPRILSPPVNLWPTVVSCARSNLRFQRTARDQVASVGRRRAGLNLRS